MSDHSMPYPVIGHFDCSRKIRLRIRDEWVDAQDELEGPDLIWGDNEVNLTGRDDASEIEVSFRIEVDITDFLKQVIVEHGPGIDGMKTIDSQVGFLVRWINKGIRRRKSKRALIVSLEARGTGKSKREFLIGECNDIRIPIAEISGRISFEPMLFAKTDLRIDSKAQWSGGPTQVIQGAMIGWSNSLEVILDKRTGQLGSIFKFVWEDFRENSGDSTESIFRIEWSNDPTIYLNREVDDFEQVLTSIANTGRAASIRDSLNSSIAMEALTVAAVSALREVEDIASRDDFSSDQILTELSPQNRTLFESFGYLYLPGLPLTYKAVEVIDHIQSAEFDSTHFVASDLPLRIQESLSMEKKTMKLLQLLDMGARTDG